jgi:hypothetical protein
MPLVIVTATRASWPVFAATSATARTARLVASSGTSAAPDAPGPSVTVTDSSSARVSVTSSWRPDGLEDGRQVVEAVGRSGPPTARG